MPKYKNILLIDDSDIDNYISKSVISKLNICDNITIINSGVKALEYLQQQETIFPDIIFLDIRMPVIDGFEFLHQFEQIFHPESLNCKIYMLSSSSSPNDMARSKDFAIIQDYINKPLHSTKLQKLFD